MKGVDAVIFHFLRRENAHCLHSIQQLWNRLAVFIPEFGKLGVVNHNLTCQDFNLLGLADLHKFWNWLGKIHKRHEAFHTVNLVLLASKMLQLLFRESEATM